MVIFAIVSIINSRNQNQLSEGLQLLLNNYQYPLFFLLLFSIAFFIRGYRWNLLVSDTANRKIYFIKLIYIAWFLNAITPGRLGDFSRVYFPRKEKVLTAGTAFSAVLIDRLFDLLILTIFLWVAVFLGIGVFIGDIGTYFTVLTLFSIFLSILLAFLLIKYPVIFDKIVNTVSFGKQNIKTIINNFLTNLK